MGFEYCRFSPAQIDVIRDPLPCRINILEGSVRSGKTIASIIRWILYVKNETSPRARLLMVGVTKDTLKQNVVDDIVLMVGERHAKYKDGKLTLFGRTIYCKGANDVKAERKIRGMTIEGAYVDEATQIPKNVLDQAITRCSKGRGRVLMTTNPDSPYHWFYTEYCGNQEKIARGLVRVWHFTLDDNFAISDEYRRDLAANFTGLWYKRMILGLWVIAEGVIYDLFDLESHGFDDDDAPKSFDYHSMAVDYGTQNAFAALLIGRKGDESWVLNEYYYSGRDALKQKTDAQYSADLKEFIGDTALRFLIHDPSAASFAAQVKEDKLAPVYPALNDVTPGIRTVLNRLVQGKVRIHKRKCPNLIKEFGSYCWDPKAALKGEDKPLKVNDHALDALRYNEATIATLPGRPRIF